MATHHVGLRRASPALLDVCVHRGVAWLAQNKPPLVAHGTSSKLRSYLYPSERLSLERPHTISVGNVQKCPSSHSHTSEQQRKGERATYPYA